MPGIGTRFGTREIRIGRHRCRSTPTAEFLAPTGLLRLRSLAAAGAALGIVPSRCADPQAALDAGQPLSRVAEAADHLVVIPLGADVQY